MSHPNPEFMKRYLRPLIGCVVTEIMDAGEGFTSLVIERGDERFECMLASDIELNEPGFLFVRAAKPPLRRKRRREGKKS